MMLLIEEKERWWSILSPWSQIWW